MEQITNENEKGEYYLTSVVKVLRQKGRHVSFIEMNPQEALGANDLIQLAHLEEIWQTRRRHHFLKQGVFMEDPKSVHLNWDTQLAPQSTLEPHVYFGPQVIVEEEKHASVPFLTWRVFI